MGDKIGWLHLYGQHLWHDEAYIAGDRAGIEMLRDALNEALGAADGVSMAADVFAGDGEGYNVSVHVLPDAEFQRLAMPYTDEIARESGGFWPWHLAVKPRHPRRPAVDAPPLPRTRLVRWRLARFVVRPR